MDFEPGAPSLRLAQLALVAPLLVLLAAAPTQKPVEGRSAVVAPIAVKRDSVPADDGVRTMRPQLLEPVRLQTKPAPSPLLTALLSAIAALLGAAIGSWASLRNARATIIQKTNELEIESIDRKLNDFIGPFIHLSDENRILAEELKRKQAGGKAFRTLTGLLTPGWRDGLSNGDRELLKTVVANGTELRRLMAEKGAGAVSPELIPYFSKASAHFRFLDLAFKDALDPDPSRYTAYVYPRQLDGVMDAELQRLLDRRETLRSKPAKPHPRMPDLVIPDDLRLS